MPPAQLRGLDLMGYLDDKLADRVSRVQSLIGLGRTKCNIVVSLLLAVL